MFLKFFGPHPKKNGSHQKKNLDPPPKKNKKNPKLYRSYYPHRSRELVSPVCGIFFLKKLYFCLMLPKYCCFSDVFPSPVKPSFRR